MRRIPNGKIRADGMRRIRKALAASARLDEAEDRVQSARDAFAEALSVLYDEEMAVFFSKEKNPGGR